MCWNKIKAQTIQVLSTGRDILLWPTSCCFFYTWKGYRSLYVLSAFFAYIDFFSIYIVSCPPNHNRIIAYMVSHIRSEPWTFSEQYDQCYVMEASSTSSTKRMGRFENDINDHQYNTISKNRRRYRFSLIPFIAGQGLTSNINDKTICKQAQNLLTCNNMWLWCSIIRNIY